MTYFDGIKVGDRVWDFERGFGKVVAIWSDSFTVQFENYGHLGRTYTFDGVKYECYKCRQSLFWDEVKFEIPQRPKIELNEWRYVIDLVIENSILELDDKTELIDYIYAVNNGLARNDKETAEKALKQIKKFTRLLALRDQECQDSRGYEPKLGKKSYGITKEAISKKFHIYETYDNCPDRVYFKTEEDAKKICDILNSRKFDLEGE